MAIQCPSAPAVKTNLMSPLDMGKVSLTVTWSASAEPPLGIGIKL